jgi:predicted nucleic-acid-binding protein
MTGLDTNVLVRFVTRDDAAQSRRADEIIANLTENEPGFVSVIVMAELAWVLERAYNYSKAEIARAIERMLQIEVLQIECEQQVLTAMIALKRGRGSFADALIGELAFRAGCSHIVTFDRKAAQLPGFALA